MLRPHGVVLPSGGGGGEAGARGGASSGVRGRKDPFIAVACVRRRQGTATGPLRHTSAETTRRRRRRKRRRRRGTALVARDDAGTWAAPASSASMMMTTGMKRLQGVEGLRGGNSLCEARRGVERGDSASSPPPPSLSLYYAPERLEGPRGAGLEEHVGRVKSDETTAGLVVLLVVASTGAAVCRGWEGEEAGGGGGGLVRARGALGEAEVVQRAGDEALNGVGSEEGRYRGQGRPCRCCAREGVGV
jgi:hypothetical protein